MKRQPFPDCRRSLRAPCQPHRRRGVTSVEFALAVTILLLFVTASLEFARISIARHAVDNASYEACRRVIVPGANTDEAIAHVESLLAKYGVTDTTVVISPSPILETTPAVTVAIHAPAGSLAWGLSKFTRGITLSSTTTLLTERVSIVQARGLTVPKPPPPPPPPPGPPEPPPGPPDTPVPPEPPGPPEPPPPPPPPTPPPLL